MKRREQGRGVISRSVLIVDDEEDILELLELTLLKMGLDVERAGSVKDAIKKVSEGSFDLCLTDMRLPDGDGLELLNFVSDSEQDLPVAVITAHGNTENAVAALKAGAFDYLAKPVSLEQLRALVKSALSLPQTGTSPKSDGEQTLVGVSAAMQSVRDLIEKLARTEAAVQISGESGSGKELAARLIHQKSVRGSKPFFPVNCGAIPENLMESEFFGYKKGAFTGADSERDGFFQAANGGTLFLDEVADLPLAMQVKLLRVIQEKKVRKVGSTQEEPVDVRIISATHKKLGEQVDAGKFRHDLYYRLNVIELRMPALRERREDIPLFVNAIIERLSAAASGPKPQVSAETMESLSRYDFPGNVRELENVLERAVALSSDEAITLDNLQLTPPTESGDVPSAVSAGGKYPLQDYLDRVEKDAILEALEKTRFNRTAAAKLLGITFRSMRYRMERLGIN